LGCIGDKKAIGPITKYLNDEDEEVRERAEGALEKLKTVRD
jgi:HEAT repeat protein